MNGGTPVWKSRAIITDKSLSCDLLIIKEDVGTKNIQEVFKKRSLILIIHPCAYQLLSPGTSHKLHTSGVSLHVSHMPGTTGISNMEANHSLGHHLQEEPFQHYIVTMMLRMDLAFTPAPPPTLCVSQLGSSTSEQNHSDLSHWQHFNEAWSQLQINWHTLHCRVSFFVGGWGGGGVATWIFHSFSPSARATACNPASRPLKMRPHFPSGAGRERRSVRRCGEHL